MTPFPGMDPYLEHPGIWPGIHNTLIAALQRTIAPLVRPKYLVRLEERTYLADPDELVVIGRPDVNVRGGAARSTAERPPRATGSLSVAVPIPDTVRETYLEVKSASSGEVVTILELLSPTNKRAGSNGRQVYETKRLQIFGTRTNLVEVDLVRTGAPMVFFGPDVVSDYRILIARGDQRPRAELLAFSIRDPIPRFALPLRGGDHEPEIDLRAILIETYTALAYAESVDYQLDAVPPLAADDAAWADGLRRGAGCR